MDDNRTVFVENLSDNLLSKFESQFDSKSLYYSNRWAELLYEGFGVNRSAILSFDRNGNIIAFTPVFVKKKFRFSLVGSPLPGTFTEHGGPVFLQEQGAAKQRSIFESHISTLRNLTSVYAEVGFNYSSPLDKECLKKVFEKHGFKHSLRPSLVLNLSLGRELIWNKMESRARGAIRKAKKHGLNCSIEPFGEHCDWYHHLVTKTFSKQKKAMPHPVSSYRALASKISENGKLFFFIARMEGAILSAGTFLVDQDRMVFHSGSSTENAGKYGASSLVQWSAIEKAIDLGLNEYDFGGIGIKSIDKFKKSFGGSYVEHHRWFYRNQILERFFGAALFLRDKGLLRLN